MKYDVSASQGLSTREFRLMTRVSSCMLLLASFGTGTYAQARAVTCPPVNGPPYLQCQVDRAAVLPKGGYVPSPPEMLKVKPFPHILEARFRFVVDTNGRVILDSVRWMEATDTMLAKGIQGLFGRIRFEPAVHGNLKVPVLLDEWFVMVGSPSGLPSLPGFRRDTTADGIPRTISGPSLPDPIGASRISPADLIAIQEAAVLDLLVDSTSSGKTGVVTKLACVAFKVGRSSVLPSRRSLRVMSTNHVKAVLPADCRKAFESAVRTDQSVDSTQAAVRNIPYYITFDSLKYWSANEVHFEQEYRRGTRRVARICGAVRSAQTWNIYCGGMREYAAPTVAW